MSTITQSDFIHTHTHKNMLSSNQKQADTKKGLASNETRSLSDLIF